MEKQLSFLDKVLRKKRSEFYSCLSDPLSDAEIKSIEEQFDVSIPADLKLLYKWKNGQNESFHEAFVNNSTFIPLDYALDVASELTSMIGSEFHIENWWNEKWIPIFENGAGDYLVYDLEGTFTGEKGQIIEFWHEENTRNILAPNLASFFQSINQYFKDTEEEDFDDCFTVDTPDGYPKNFVVEKEI